MDDSTSVVDSDFAALTPDVTPEEEDDRRGLLIAQSAYGIGRVVCFSRDTTWRVDGATTWQAFRKVIVPLAAPGVSTTAIIAFFIAWNDFAYGISLPSTERSRPGRAGPAHRRLIVRGFDGAIAAAAVIVPISIPVVVLLLLFQRRIVAGLTNGAVKG